MNGVVGISPAPDAYSVLPVRIAILSLLWGVFFIKFPVLIVIGLLVGVFVVAHYAINVGRVDRINLLIGLNFAYWLYSGLLTGALDLGMLLTPSYYQNEGRIFVSYVAFIIISSSLVGTATLNFVIRQIGLMAAAGVLLYFVWVAIHPEILSVGRAHNFSGFLSSHTGSGVFFSVLCTFLVIYGATIRSRKLVLLGFVTLLPVLGSGSRASLVALAAVLVWYLSRTVSLKSLLVSSLLVVGLIGAMPTIAPHTYERTAKLFQASTLQSVKAQVVATQTSNWQPGLRKDIEGEEVNILTRILYWGHAMKLFLQSPVLGAGFGRFNDLNVHYEGIRGFYYFGVSGQNNPATLSAHNSYLQMLAETGVVGLGLLLSVWYQLWRRMERARREFANAPEIAGFYLALQGLIIFVLVTALVGHALASPLNSIPVLALLGLGSSFYRNHTQTRQQTAQSESPSHPNGLDPV